MLLVGAVIGLGGIQPHHSGPRHYLAGFRSISVESPNNNRSAFPGGPGCEPLPQVFVTLHLTVRTWHLCVDRLARPCLGASRLVLRIVGPFQFRLLEHSAHHDGVLARADDELKTKKPTGRSRGPVRSGGFGSNKGRPGEGRPGTLFIRRHFRGDRGKPAVPGWVAKQSPPIDGFRSATPRKRWPR